MRAGVAALALAAMAAASACGGSGGDKAGGAREGAPVVLAVAVHDPLYAHREFAAAVERLSGGSIELQLREQWRQGEVEYERGIVEDVRAGKADVGVVGARVWNTFGVASFQAVLAPFLVDTLALQRRLLDGPIGPRLLGSVAKAGVVGVAVLPGAAQRPFGITRGLVGPRDYEGARIGIHPGGSSESSFRALGASAEGYRADSLWQLDGAELDLVTIADNFYDERGRALTANVVLWPRVQTIFMGRAAFEALTPAQRVILRRAAVETVGAVVTDIETEEEAALAAVCDRGLLPLVSASPADLAALREAVQPVYADLERDAETKQLLAEITQLGGESRERAHTLRCPGETGGAHRDASVLEGRWRYEPTREELLDVGLSPRDAEMLSGSAIFEFADGRFKAIAGGNDAAAGTYSLEGDIISLVFETGPAVRPGHVFQLEWSVYRDVLTFSRVPGREPLLALMARPLTRVR